MASAEKGIGIVMWYGYQLKLITEGSTKMKKIPTLEKKIKNNLRFWF